MLQMYECILLLSHSISTPQLAPQPHAKAEGGYVEGPTCLTLRSLVNLTLQGVAIDGRATVSAGFAPNMDTQNEKPHLISPSSRTFHTLPKAPGSS